MKKILRLTLLFTFALVTANLIWSNLYFQFIPWTIIKTAFILSIFEVLLKPLLKIILFPINLLTLGFFRIVIETFGLYLAVFLFSDFQIQNIHTPASNFYGLTLPQLNITGFWVFLVTSLTIGLLLNIFNLIVRKKPKK
jgi:uncharacterized membrane protein YvlD (DUF360 family)